MAIAMVAMLAFGGTYAYFTATATEKTSSVKTGIISLKVGSVATKTDATVVYDEEVLGAVNFNASETTVDSYLFVTITTVITPNKDDTASAVTFVDIFGSDLTVKTGWTKVEGVTVANGVVYSYTLAADATGKDNIAFIDSLKVTASPNWDETTNKMPLTMGVGIELTISGKAIQQTGFDSVADAYNAVKDVTAHADK